MEHLVLKQEIVEAIMNDSALFGKVADMLNVKPVTLPQILAANKPRLTQAAILKILRDHLGKKKDSDLLTIMQEPKKTVAA